MKLIDKDALVAEIERKMGICKKVVWDLRSQENKDYYQGKAEAYKDTLDLLDTLEVKDVDLEKEARHYLLYKHLSPLSEVMHQADLKAEMQYHKDIENAFKAGVELGISVSNKAQKGE